MHVNIRCDANEGLCEYHEYITVLAKFLVVPVAVLWYVIRKCLMVCEVCARYSLQIVGSS